MKTKKILILFTCCIFLRFSCKRDNLIINEEEIITTLNYTLVSTSGDTAVFSFQDIDGNGGNAPLISSDTLMANSSYSGQLTMLNEAVNPATNITNEVIDEAESHQAFYTLSLNNTTFSYSDTDLNGNPIGIQTNITTGASEQGTLSIVLRHEPDKYAPGVFDGIINNAGGETDIEVSFSVHVQ
jgi:hypothetical protein